MLIVSDKFIIIDFAIASSLERRGGDIKLHAVVAKRVTMRIITTTGDNGMSLLIMVHSSLFAFYVTSHQLVLSALPNPFHYEWFCGKIVS